MLQTFTVESKTLDLAKKILAIPELQNTRLVGGTGLALIIGHRNSIDLDFFGTIEMQPNELLFVLSQHELNAKFIHKSQTIFITEIDTIKVDFVNYPYKWIEDAICDDEIRIAGLKDIAAMKLSAITNRGTKKDFVDIFYLLKKFSLPEMLEFYMQKYYDGSKFMVLKSLSYFNDAEAEPLPKMYEKITWQQIKNEICLNIRKNL